MTPDFWHPTGVVDPPRLRLQVRRVRGHGLGPVRDTLAS
jgi:hypothetical protein